VVVAGHLLALPSAMVAVAGALLCFAIRVMAILRSWQLPGPPSVKRREANTQGSRKQKDR
jgi:uncharacterized membrane protein YeiH